MCPISPIVHCSSSSDDQHQKGQNGCSVGSAAGGGVSAEGEGEGTAGHVDC